jgi:hypothetical protein
MFFRGCTKLARQIGATTKKLSVWTAAAKVLSLVEVSFMRLPRADRFIRKSATE